MKIASHPTAQVKRGDFAAEVLNGQLTLPRRLAEFLAQSNIRSAEDFVAVMEPFESSFADEFEWSEEEVRAAARSLVRRLEGHVRREILHPPKPQRVPFGVSPARRV